MEMFVPGPYNDKWLIYIKSLNSALLMRSDPQNILTEERPEHMKPEVGLEGDSYHVSGKEWEQKMGGLVISNPLWEQNWHLKYETNIFDSIDGLFISKALLNTVKQSAKTFSFHIFGDSLSDMGIPSQAGTLHWSQLWFLHRRIYVVPGRNGSQRALDTVCHSQA